MNSRYLQQKIDFLKLLFHLRVHWRPNCKYVQFLQGHHCWSTRYLMKEKERKLPNIFRIIWCFANKFRWNTRIIWLFCLRIATIQIYTKYTCTIQKKGWLNFASKHVIFSSQCVRLSRNLMPKINSADKIFAGS